jgi:large subunit ribosomal protein L9
LGRREAGERGACRVAKYQNVILLEHSDELGRKGEEIKVRHGHARNLLLPTRRAVVATPETRAKFRIELTEEEETKLRTLRERNLLKRLVEAVVLEFSQRTVDGQKLYGSVSLQDIASSLRTSEASIVVSSDRVKLNKKLSSNPYVEKTYAGDAEAPAAAGAEPEDLERGIKSIGAYLAAVEAAEGLWCSILVRVHPA